MWLLVYDNEPIFIIEDAMPSFTKRVNAEKAEDVRDKASYATRGTTINPHGIAQYAIPHAHQILRSRNGYSLALATDGRFAVGPGIRTGSVIPRDALLYDSKEVADAAFQEVAY